MTLMCEHPSLIPARFSTPKFYPHVTAGQYARIGWFKDEYWGKRGVNFAGSGYYFGEKTYQIQSLVSKTLLLWLVVGGSNQPNELSQ